MSLSVLVLMPFAKKFNRRHELAIKRAVHGVGMRAERVDEQSFHHQGITDRIIKQIEEADVLIADMSEKNQNVSYEVGYAHAKNKLCILLTNDPNAILFDLKNRQHIVFSGLDDLKEKLMKDLEALKVEMELFFDSTDAERVARVYGFHCEIKPKSQATSIRSKVKNNSELHHKNVLAHMINIKRRIIGTKQWEQFKLAANPVNVGRHWQYSNRPTSFYFKVCQRLPY